MRVLCLITLCAATLAAQPVSLGVKGGIRFGDFSLQDGAHQESRFYTVGPTVEVRLPWRSLSLEMDALYKYSGTSIATTDLLNWFYFDRTRVASWDIPLLVKYSLPAGSPRLRPFLNGGYALRLKRQETFNIFSSTEPPPYGPFYSTSSMKYRWETDHGLAFGGGVVTRISHLKIAPEFRYTRWPTIQNSANRLGGSTGLNPQQFEILLGLRF
jgi:hypothetical protein